MKCHSMINCPKEMGPMYFKYFLRDTGLKAQHFANKYELVSFFSAVHAFGSFSKTNTSLSITPNEASYFTAYQRFTDS